MKNIKNLKELTIAVLILSMVGFLGSCAASGQSAGGATDASASVAGKKGRKSKKEEIYNPSGVWQYEVETPDGGSSGIMRINGEPGNFEVLLDTDQFGELRVYNLEMTGDSMRGMIDAGGMTAEIEGDFDGETFTGALIVGDEAYPLEAERVNKG